MEKIRDIVGLYLHPPERAVVLCVDEKAQSQALRPHAAGAADGARRAGAGARMTIGRHGTTSLFAALNVATRGK